MESQVFVQRAKNIQKNFKTTYMWGTFGSLVSETLIYQKTKQYPTWYKPVKVAKLRKMVGKDVWAFDCVGLIKAILWGWEGRKNCSYGGATYGSNKVPDISADQMIQRCNDVSTNFSNIVPGEVVWTKGHIGIYVGNGLVIECTSSWNSCVQMSALGNVSSISGYRTRSWTKHGKLPWVDYNAEEEEEELKPQKIKIEVEGKPKQVLSVNIEGSNFVKLRDIAEATDYETNVKKGVPILTRRK